MTKVENNNRNLFHLLFVLEGPCVVSMFFENPSFMIKVFSGKYFKSNKKLKDILDISNFIDELFYFK